MVPLCHGHQTAAHIGFGPDEPSVWRHFFREGSLTTAHREKIRLEPGNQASVWFEMEQCKTNG